MDNRRIGARAGALVLLAATAFTALVVCRPGATARAMSAGDPTSAVVVAAAWVAWALAGYLLVSVAVTAAAQLPRCPLPVVGLAHAIAPAVVRRFTQAVVGATAVAAIAAGPGVALADPPTPAAPGATRPVPVLDWPGLPAPVSLVAPAGTRQLPAHDSTIVVRPGDTLWSLAARQLGPGATDEQIARAWPRLYAANRAVIGADPDLIRPGQRLVPVPLDSRSHP